MEVYLKKPLKVRFTSLYLDPNNPRLGREDHPGYAHPKSIFDTKLQNEL